MSDKATWPFQVLEQLLQPNANNITTDNPNISYDNYADISDNSSFDATSATLEELEHCFGLRLNVQEPVTDPLAIYGHAVSSVNCFHNIYHRGSRFTQLPMYLFFVKLARGAVASFD